MVSNFLNKIDELTQNHSNINENIRCYLFGSFLINKIGFSDIDLLIVYKSSKSLNSLKTDLEYFELKYPIDITFLSEEEEKELDFINKVNAKRIKE